MSTEAHTGLFGSKRERVGYNDTTWTVWILGTDELHDHKTLADALEYAAEQNAIFADMRMRNSSENSPVLYAVVLHHGYAWTQATEHANGVDCGHPDCGNCSFDRAAHFDRAEMREVGL